MFTIADLLNAIATAIVAFFVWLLWYSRHSLFKKLVDRMDDLETSQEAVLSTLVKINDNEITEHEAHESFRTEYRTDKIEFEERRLEEQRAFTQALDRFTVILDSRPCMIEQPKPKCPEGT